jgi:hypothetical protein
MVRGTIPRMERFHTNPQSLEHLLSSINERKLALPDFQRDFVWLPRATEGLIESMARAFPAGSLLFYPYKPGVFQPRAVQNAPALDGVAPLELVLDGQQRLTSLYQALYGVGDHRYFIDLQVLRDGGDIDEAIFFRHRTRASKSATLDQQAATLTLPLGHLFGGGGFQEWLPEVLDRRPETGDERRQLRQELQGLHAQWLKPIETYRFPVISLAHDTDIEAVCSIFETLNNTGMTLTVFELLAARYYAQQFDLRRAWAESKERHPLIEAFDVNPYYVLQAISLRTGRSVKRGDVLELTVEQIQEHWDDVVRGFAAALTMLRDDCGVKTVKWLPYGYQLVPLAGVWSAAGEVPGPAAAGNRGRLQRWFWCSSLAQAYDRAANSQAAKDFNELRRWFAGGAAPDVVEQFAFESAQLSAITPRQQAIYKALMALVLQRGARDFHRAAQLTAEGLAEKGVDDHHVFPRAHLNPTGEPARYPAELVDSILNRTMIDADTNKRIGKRDPRDYLAEVKGELDATEDASTFRRLLDSHLLPADDEGPLLQGDFERFVKWRIKAFVREVDRVTGVAYRLDYPHLAAESDAGKAVRGGFS